MAAGVYLSEAPDPLPPPPSYTLYEYIGTVPLYLFTQEGEGGEPVRRLRGALVNNRGRKYQHDWRLKTLLNTSKDDI